MKKISKRSLRLENLEDRRLLAVTFGGGFGPAMMAPSAQRGTEMPAFEAPQMISTESADLGTGFGMTNTLGGPGSMGAPGGQFETQAPPTFDGEAPEMGEIPEDGERPDIPAPPTFDGEAPEMGEIPEDGELPDIPAPPTFDGEAPEMGEIPEDGERPDIPAPPTFDGEAPEMGEIPEDGERPDIPAPPTFDGETGTVNTDEDGEQQEISAPAQRQQTGIGGRNRMGENRFGIAGSQASSRQNEGIVSNTRGAMTPSFGNQTGPSFGGRNSRTESADAFFEELVQTDLDLKLDIF